VRVNLQHNLQLKTAPATQVVIESDDGLPLMVALQIENTIIVAKADDPDFQEMLKAAGIDRVVPVYDIRAKPISQLSWKQ